jgi:hypothetical protein
MEGVVFDTLEQWFNQNDEGTTLWVSPPHPTRTNDTKIIFHEIAYTSELKKVIKNTVGLFRATEVQTMSILAEFIPGINSISSFEELRSLLINVDDSFDPQELVTKIKAIDSNSFIVNEILNREQLKQNAEYVSRLFDSGANATFIAYEMQRLGLIGKFSLSCPRSQTFSELLLGTHIEDQYGSLTFKCEKCKRMNIRPFGQLISHCQHCGTDVSCK